jgi:selenocysteine-specific elongation factor
MHIIGTAGHVDHGKTALIEALTGIDADRLPEEKSRGMTIDLGFAHFAGRDGKAVGVIDVPGHERFIRNMVAGAWSLSCAVLVLAANEGWMRQTEDHARVLEAMGIDRIVCALTKVDLVDKETLALAKEEARGGVERIFQKEVPLIPVSSLNGEGIDILRDHLLDLLEGLPEPEQNGTPFIHIDRVFTVPGAGTVITGSLSGGQIHEGDEITILPEGRKTKIRGIHSYYQPVKSAYPLSRVACNLQGLKKEELSRGSIAVREAELFWTEKEFIIRWEPLGDEKGLVKNHMELELAVATGHYIGSIHFLKTPGFARMVFSKLLSVVPFAPVLFIRRGGYRILARGFFFYPGATDRPFKIRLSSLLERFPSLGLMEKEWMNKGVKERELPLRFLLQEWILLSSDREFRSELQSDKEVIHRFLSREKVDARFIGNGVILEERWQRELDKLKRLASAKGGVTLSAALGSSKLPREIWAALVEELQKEGDFLQREQLLISSTQLQEEEELSPTGRNILALLNSEEMKGLQLKDIREPGAKKELRNLVRIGKAVSLEDDIYYSYDRFQGLTARILEGLKSGARFSIPEAKEKTGLSRRYIIPVLNKMEEQGLLSREGDLRILS